MMAKLSVFYQGLFSPGHTELKLSCGALGWIEGRVRGGIIPYWVATAGGLVWHKTNNTPLCVPLFLAFQQNNCLLESLPLLQMRFLKLPFHPHFLQENLQTHSLGVQLFSPPMTPPVMQGKVLEILVLFLTRALFLFIVMASDF